MPLCSGDVKLICRHSETEETCASEWPHKFDCVYEMTLGKEKLCTRLRVTNTGDIPMEFTCALHTYFRVGDVKSVSVHGLQGVEYEDNADGGKLVTETAEAITFSGEVDRVYGPAPGLLKVADSAGKRVIDINKDDGFPDAVVWNPWVDKAAALADLPDAAFNEFVCVEVGAIRKPVIVQPGAEWSGAQTICVKKF